MQGVGWVSWESSGRRRREEIDRGKTIEEVSGGGSIMKAQTRKIDSWTGGGVVWGRKHHPTHGWWA